MKYKSVIVTRFGRPEVFQVIENDLRAPAAGEARIRGLAAPVCRPDVTVRQGVLLYHGTPLGQKLPFTPGYWDTLFQWLAERKIEPVIRQRFPIFGAAQVNALMETGEVLGNVVLQAPERLAIVP